ncbi:MAG: alanine racemase [Ruminococcus sp.]|nr:alanine racemase [Ruminococcus sp.]
MTDSYVEINLTKLAANVRAILDKYPEYRSYIGVVKGDAYGHGMRAVKALHNGGIRYFAVSSLEEAKDLRSYNAHVPVLCLEPVAIERLNEAADLDLTLAIPDIEYLREMLESGVEHSFKLHLQVDAGFGRLGFKDKGEIKEAVQLINSSSHFLEGIYQHFATAGIFDPHYDNQIRRFKELTSLIDLNEIPIVHLGSGVSLLAHPKIDIATATRMGLIMYGYHIGPSSYGSGVKDRLRDLRDKRNQRKYHLTETIRDVKLDLTPAMSYKCRILQIKDVNAGEYVGYNADYQATELISIAVLPVGYNNGIGHANYGRVVEINGKRYPIIGEIGMNMCCVKIDNRVKLTDTVTVLGGGISLGRFSRSSGLGLAEILLGIGKNNERVYVK